ncbi:12044_t:CDS:2 [Funneliformis geosporum]|uniref:1688_t:CDS:1 n=1 Tax=Funneliformis geosporum TaxID=1117311 RepID=A0A9W4WU19_9GLOM|nr:12044_t:CDS:2 [Funneliformis geosporum]CAI2172153.1 1688_t:CDS:2 [Funneliformis geosporum]
MTGNKITQLTYQMSISNSLEIKEDIYSPIFSTGDNMLWQLWFVPLIKNPVNNKEYCSIYILPVANPDETSWRKRSKYSIKLFVKEIKNFQTYNLISSNNELSISPNTKIENGYGYPEAFERTSIYNGELIIKNLVEAWKNQLFNIQPVDVEFNVQGEKFYACSSILIQRSKYFENALSGIWAESTVDRQSESDEDFDHIIESKSDSESNEEKLKYQIKHRINISDYKPLSFAKLLSYLYTNHIDWATSDNNTIEDNNISFTIEIYCIADRYLLTDLCQRAKNRIFEELTIDNAAEIMFRLVPKYEDLKEPILSFMAENFEAVCNSKGFKDVLANPNDYTCYNQIMSEVLSNHFKIQKAKLNKQSTQTQINNHHGIGLPQIRPPPGIQAMALVRPPPMPYHPSVGVRQPPMNNNNTRSN